MCVYIYIYIRCKTIVVGTIVSPHLWDFPMVHIMQFSSVLFSFIHLRPRHTAPNELLPKFQENLKMLSVFCEYITQDVNI